MSDPGPSNPSPSSATPAQPSPSQSEPAPQTPPTPSPTFYSQAANSAQQTIQSISRSLPRFPTPTLRVQRVNQLDAQLLDAELTELLLEPVKKALGVVKSTLPADLESELLLFLRLALFKFSIWDRGASYGSMLQNLKYRNEWAHRGGLQSTSTDQPLTKLQLCLYPLLTIILPYANTKFQDKVNSVDASSDLSPDGSTTRRRRRRILNLTDSFQRLWAAAALVNFAIFLSNGK
ncbi:hypothetical protein IE53DRAFT_206583 [Violaceomyces palustris]|uniref:Uncharacterized protein n=1 Tax=Violaceomyces palustris TaxID=1673888 RepID=A0ACD0NR03_9BASI|nr:hypothetical protein IE53DRAFT_206583 [Violaceomyces palustris]